MVNPGLSSGATYSQTAGATYILKPNLDLDGYFVWENDNTATEPAGTGQNLGQQLGISGTDGAYRYQSGLPWFTVSIAASRGAWESPPSGRGPKRRSLTTPPMRRNFST